MELAKLVALLEPRLRVDLPGKASHQKMAPLNRSLEPDPKQRLRESAVLILLYPKNNEPYIVFMRRPTYKGPHSGQISFPGGKREESDPTLQDVALRETEEELGICAQKVHIIGELTSLIIPHSGYRVAPFVGYLDQTPNFYPCEIEVDELIEVPMRVFENHKIVKEFTFIQETRSIHAPYFDLNGEKLWGATSMILCELLDILQNNKLL